MTTRLDSKEYMRKIRVFESSKRLFNQEDILALTRLKSTHAMLNKPQSSFAIPYLLSNDASTNNISKSGR
jgi:hypothetical protein